MTRPRLSGIGEAPAATRIARVCAIILGCSLWGGVHARVFAQDQLAGVSAFRQQLAPFAERVRTALGRDHAPFRSTLDALAEEEARQRALRGELGFSFTGDEAGDYGGVGPGNETLFRFGVSAALRRGTVPASFQLAADVDAQVRDNVFEQDVTRFRASYAYRRSRHMEPFVWAERQTNSYMSVASRYEAGAGVRIGADLWPARAGEPADGALAHLTREGPAGFGCAVQRIEAAFHSIPPSTPDPCHPVSFDAPPATSPGPTSAAFEGLRAAIPNLARALRARESRLYVGLGLGVFSELEQAVIETGVSALEPRETDRPLRVRTVRLPGRHRYRMLVTPTFRMRPLRDVTLSFVPHFKLPISSPRIGHNDVVAYRMDLFFGLDWALARRDTRAETVRLVLKFDYYKNMGPPAMTNDIIHAAAIEGLAYDRTIATKKHRVVSLGVVIGLPR